MKFLVRSTLVFGAALTLSFSPLANAQGPLTPPGAPAPSFKTLQQVEPRTPIQSLPFTINQPGSYYLTTNLTANALDANGITVATSAVTLDLRGFALVGLSGVTG